jgi:hypothetical protein
MRRAPFFSGLSNPSELKTSKKYHLPRLHEKYIFQNKIFTPIKSDLHDWHVNPNKIIFEG